MTIPEGVQGLVLRLLHSCQLARAALNTPPPWSLSNRPLDHHATGCGRPCAALVGSTAANYHAYQSTVILSDQTHNRAAHSAIDPWMIIPEGVGGRVLRLLVAPLPAPCRCPAAAPRRRLLPLPRCCHHLKTATKQRKQRFFVWSLLAYCVPAVTEYHESVEECNHQGPNNSVAASKIHPCCMFPQCLHGQAGHCATASQQHVTTTPSVNTENASKHTTGQWKRGVKVLTLRRQTAPAYPGPLPNLP